MSNFEIGIVFIHLSALCYIAYIFKKSITDIWEAINELEQNND